MTFQAHDGHSARSEELHRHILRSHLAYLNQEETPAKLQQRHNLESLISEFLSVVSHNAKFTFFEVSKILNDSIENNEGFSAYKAGSAFEALEKYATNLISHPWRKEYKTVKLYSGFYKHSVESQLLNGKSVFHLLGYQFTDEGVLYLDEPVDPDKVARVALDCLTAYVECQIMLQICERVKAFKCSWFDIHQVRQDYVCGIDEAVRILHQLKRNEVEQEKQDRWIREQENSFSLKTDAGSNYQKTGILVDVSNTWPSNGSTYSGYSSAVVMPSGGSYTSKPHKGGQLSHTKLPSWSEGVVNHHDRNFLPKSDETDGYVSRSLDDHHSSQGNYNYLGKSNNSVESRYANHDLTPESWNDSWDVLQPSYHDGYMNEGYRTGYNHNNAMVPNVKETYSSHFGHLYPSHGMMPLGYNPPMLHHDSLPSQRPCQPPQMCCDHLLSVMPPAGKYPYNSMKEGGDNFESSRRSMRIEAEDPTEMCSSFLKMSVDGPPSSLKPRHFPVGSAFTPYQPGSANPSGDSLLRSGKTALVQNGSKRGSYYDNVPAAYDITEAGSSSMAGPSLPSSAKCDFHQTNGTLPAKLRTSKDSAVASKPVLKKSYSNSSEVPSSGVTVSCGTTDSKSSKCLASSKDLRVGKKWSCTSCTFYNAPEKNICDMCGRSRLPGPEVTPLVSGGRECPQCTLVNKKDCEDCTACGASLKDSPTYI